MGTRYERLREELERAVFAFLMDRVAYEEGARLMEENERLLADSDAAVPEAVDRACRKTIRRALAKKSRKRARAGAVRLLQRAAVVIIILIALFMAAYAAFPEFRAETLNVLIKNSNVASRLNLKAGDENVTQGGMASGQTLMGYAFPNVSKKFSVVDKGEDRLGAWVRYSNDRSEIINLFITKSGVQYIDTEDAEKVEEILINDYQGMMIKEGNVVKICWTDIDNDCYIELTGINTNGQLIQKLAEEIIYVG